MLKRGVLSAIVMMILVGGQLAITLNSQAPPDEVPIPAPASICGGDDRLDTICYAATYPELTQAADAVGVLVSNNFPFCTVWRIGPDNRLITRGNCLLNQAATSGIEVWFGYGRASSSCGPLDTSTDPLPLPGTYTQVNVATLIANDPDLNVSIFTVDDPAALDAYGTLRLDPRPPVNGELIAIPQIDMVHPQSLAVSSDEDTNGLCRIAGAPATTPTNTYYRCDGPIGSYGAPVIAQSSNAVLALHMAEATNSPQCQISNSANRGITALALWPFVQNYLFDPAVATGLDIGTDDYTFNWAGASAAQGYRLEVYTNNDALAYSVDLTPAEAACEGDMTCSYTANPSLVNGAYSWQIVTTHDAASVAVGAATLLTTSDRDQFTITQTEADLRVEASLTTDPATVGADALITFNVENLSPVMADATTVTISLSNGLTLQATQGCSNDPDGVPTCPVGNVVVGSPLEAGLTVRVEQAALGVLQTVQFSATSSVTDANPGDNSATVTFTPTFDISYMATTSGAPTFDRPKLDGTALMGGQYRYHAQSFSVGATLEYTINSDPAYDALAYLYAGGFNPADPLTNFVQATNAATFDVLLQAGTAYTLVMTGVTTTDSGSFTNTLSGYGVITLSDTIEPPGAFALLTPADDSSIDPVAGIAVLQWGIAPDAEGYTLAINRVTPAPALIFDADVTSALQCMGGQCTFTPDSNLQAALIAGEYTWNVTAYNSAGETDASNGPFTFVIETATSAEPLTRISPVDRATVAANPVTLAWVPHPDSEWYHVYLVSAYGTVEQWVDAATCTPTCAAAPITLNNAVYQWWLAGYDLDTGTYNTDWAQHMTYFTVALTNSSNVARIAPAPYAVLDTPVTALTWTHNSALSWYHVILAGPGYSFDNWYAAGSLCAGGTCTLTDAANLVNGEYRLWLAGWDGAALGAYTESVFWIEVALPGVLVNPTPNGTSASAGTVTFAWDADPGALWGHLVISGPNGYAYNIWHEVATMCAGGRCTVDVALNRPGTYSWWVGAWGPGGMGPYNGGAPYTAYTVTVN